MTDILSPINSTLSENLLSLISLFAISLAIYLYFITKIFMLKEYEAREDERKKETMRKWVHENLIEDVYIPLAEYAWAISDTLSHKKYGEGIVLYRMSKFLHHVFKNREIFGGDVYFTPNEDNNQVLENISDKIISEINMTYYLSYAKNPVERRIVIVEFLATCAKCRNYSEFKLLISSRPIFNKDLTDEINKLRDAYSDEYHLLFGCDDYSNIFLNPINELKNPQNIEQAWRKAKLYAYCSLFNKLFMYEIHKIHDSWYVDYSDTLKYHQLIDVIGRVNELVKKMDGKLEDDQALREMSYSKLPSIGYINDRLDTAKQELMSMIDPRMKMTFNQGIALLEISKTIELLYIISPQKYEVLERERAKEFYRYIITMDVSKNLLTKILKIRYWMVR